MRIISGIYKGRNIQAPAFLPVRPTTDFGRTGLFNLLNNRIDFEQVSFLDLFSGTGIISLEMASRGCKKIIAVDNNRGCVQFLLETIKELKTSDIQVIKEDVFKFLNNTNIKTDIIFADPPYKMKNTEDIPRLIIKKKMINPNGLLILEHGDDQSFDNFPQFSEVKNYGNVNFSIFQF